MNKEKNLMKKKIEGKCTRIIATKFIKNNNSCECLSMVKAVISITTVIKQRRFG